MREPAQAVPEWPSARCLDCGAVVEGRDWFDHRWDIHHDAAHHYGHLETFRGGRIQGGASKP